MSLWGIYFCPKWFNIFNVESNVLILVNNKIYFIIHCTVLPFICPKTKSQNRIGPHNYNILCICSYS